MTDTFAHWLRQQNDRDDVVGELARSIENDEMFPAHGDKAIFDGYFSSDNTVPEVRASFERAWEEFSGNA
ncbi:MAG: YozE family protein [Mycetocola sp.]